MRSDLGLGSGGLELLETEEMEMEDRCGGSIDRGPCLLHPLTQLPSLCQSSVFLLVFLHLFIFHHVSILTVAICPSRALQARVRSWSMELGLREEEEGE